MLIFLCIGLCRGVCVRARILSRDRVHVQQCQTCHSSCQWRSPVLLKALCQQMNSIYKETFWILKYIQRCMSIVIRKPWKHFLKLLSNLIFLVEFFVLYFDSSVSVTTGRPTVHEDIFSKVLQSTSIFSVLRASKFAFLKLIEIVTFLLASTWLFFFFSYYILI